MSRALRRNRGPRSLQQRNPLRAARALISSVVVVGFFAAAVATGKVAMPEQKISGATLVQGHPVLTATGSTLFGDWLSFTEAPRTGVGYGYSLDAGATWVREIGLSVQPPFDHVVIPTAQPAQISAHHNATLASIRSFGPRATPVTAADLQLEA